MNYGVLQEVFNKNHRGGGRSQRRREKSDRYFEMKRQREEERNQHRGGHHGRGMRRHAMCKFWHEGSCRQGDNCQYSHEGPIPKAKRQLKLCKYFLNSICTKGSDCIYMHGDFPCKFFHQNGHCKEGSQCRFSHQPLNDVTRGILERVRLSGISNLEKLPYIVCLFAMLYSVSFRWKLVSLFQIVRFRWFFLLPI